MNGPSSTVVSGDYDAVVAAFSPGPAAGYVRPPLAPSVDYPGHTSAPRPLRGELAELLPKSAFQDGPVKFVSSALGAEVGGDVDFSQFWYESLCSTVRFDQAVVVAQKAGADTFVELSAHLLVVVSACRTGRDEESAVIVGSGASRGVHCRCAVGKHRRCRERRSRLPVD